MNLKRCSKCGEEKPLGEFYVTKYVRKDGTKSPTPWCKPCCRKYRREYKARMPKQALRDSYDKWYSTKGRFTVALKNSELSAVKYGYKKCNATKEELEAQFTGKCHLCAVPELELNKKLCVDHCHETGSFRGFLCRKCNSALGLFNDSEELLIDALHYLMNCKVK